MRGPPIGVVQGVYSVVIDDCLHYGAGKIRVARVGAGVDKGADPIGPGEAWKAALAVHEALGALRG